MIELRSVAVHSPGGRLLLDGLDLTVPKGCNLIVTGPSGSGKTELLKVLSGTDRPAGGNVSIGGCPVWPGDGALGMIGRVKLGFAFASGGLLSNLSLWENAALPLRFQGLSEREVARRVNDALGRLGLQSVARLRPHAVRLSARKHADLARILALSPDVIVLDDPMDGHDTADKAIALEVMRQWFADPQCTLVVAAEDTHPFDHMDAATLSLAHSFRSLEPE
jgi:D-methionine transport system ATP-binding protein